MVVILIIRVIYLIILLFFNDLSFIKEFDKRNFIAILYSV